jgi:imidazolonepropionase
MTTVDLLITNCGQLCTVPRHDAGPQRGAALGDLGIIENGALAIDDGIIVGVGDSAEISATYKAARTIDAAGHCVVPGFVDPHSHIPWIGDRAGEFEQRIGGATYMEIMQAGGGIMATVRRVRSATVADLVADNAPRLQRMLAHGTTSLECKTGYGLSTDAEIKQLDAIAALNVATPVELTPTFLPAHAVPADYRDRTEAYVQLVIDEMLPAGARWMAQHNTPLFFDVFCEHGVFDLAQTQRMLAAAQRLGFALKLHADEFVGLGGTKLAVEMGATSADHLVHTPQADIDALGAGKTVAVGLPATPFGLGQQAFTPARAILAAGGALALASDCNPGTAWCESMQLVMAIACRYMRLTPAQALAAATINAAFAIGRGTQVGSLEVGKQADVLILNVDSYQMLGYRFGSNLVQKVIKRGATVVGD